MMVDERVWKPNRPRFIVSEDERGLVAEDRVFKNGECVFNQNLGHAYSVDEIVEVLNHDYFQSYLSELLQEKIWYCQGMYWRTGDEKYKIQEECLKTLRDECYDYGSIFKYSDVLNEWCLENRK